jgi:putative ABC transport system ATP-binding protein
MTAPLIETQEVQVIYGVGDAEVRALDGVSMRVEPGEFLAIMGPSGSGKSTLLHVLGCMARPSAGHYILDGEDVSSLDRAELAAIRNRKLGFVFQSYNLLPRTSALENVMLPLVYDRDEDLSAQERQERALKMLDDVGLGQRASHQPRELSGGEQQRVAIARALVNDPLLILADEPTGNLDSQSGEEVMQVLERLNEQGRTIVMVTHDAQIAKHTRRTIHLHDGRIQAVVENGKGLRGSAAEEGQP